MFHFHKEKHKQPCWLQNYGEQSPLMRLCFFCFSVKKVSRSFSSTGRKERVGEDSDFQALQTLTGNVVRWQVIYLLSFCCEITILISHRCERIKYYMFKWP